MLKNNIAVEEIAKYTNLSIDAVEQIRKELES